MSNSLYHRNRAAMASAQSRWDNMAPPDDPTDAEQEACADGCNGCDDCTDYEDYQDEQENNNG